MRLSYAILFVSDMQRSIAFYRDLVGLPLRFETPEWTEFATEGATLALHKAAAGALASAANVAGTCRPGLSVTDLSAFHARMLANSVPCVQAPKDVFGTMISQYADPDGIAISVSQERGK